MNNLFFIIPNQLLFGRHSCCGVEWSWIIEGKEKILLRRKWNCYGSQERKTLESLTHETFTTLSKRVCICRFPQTLFASNAGVMTGEI